MTSSPWRRRRSVRPPTKKVPSTSTNEVSERPRFPSATTSKSSTFPETRQPRAIPKLSTRTTPTSVPNRNSGQTLRNRGSGIAALSLVCVVVIITGWILFRTGSDLDTSELSVRTTVSTTASREGLSERLPTSTIRSSVLNPSTTVSLDTIIKSIVSIEADCPSGLWSGSGTIVLDGSYVLTNQHVAESSDCEFLICFTDTWTKAPVCDAYGQLIADDVENDLAVLKLVDAYGEDYKSNRQPVTISSTEVEINEKIYLVGYPGVGGDTITSVSGVVSGLRVIPPGSGELQGEFIKTDARSGPGVSGGAALNAAGEYVGTPTGGTVNRDEGTSLDLVRPARFARAILDRISPD